MESRPEEEHLTFGLEPLFRTSQFDTMSSKEFDELVNRPPGSTKFALTLYNRKNFMCKSRAILDLMDLGKEFMLPPICIDKKSADSIHTIPFLEHFRPHGVHEISTIFIVMSNIEVRNKFVEFIFYLIQLVAFEARIVFVTDIFDRAQCSPILVFDQKKFVPKNNIPIFQNPNTWNTLLEMIARHNYKENLNEGPLSEVFVKAFIDLRDEDDMTRNETADPRYLFRISDYYNGFPKHFYGKLFPTVLIANRNSEFPYVLNNQLRYLWLQGDSPLNSVKGVESVENLKIAFTSPEIQFATGRFTRLFSNLVTLSLHDTCTTYLEICLDDFPRLNYLIICNVSSRCTIVPPTKKPRLLLELTLRNSEAKIYPEYGCPENTLFIVRLETSGNYVPMGDYAELMTDYLRDRSFMQYPLPKKVEKEDTERLMRLLEEYEKVFGNANHPINAVDNVSLLPAPSVDGGDEVEKAPGKKPEKPSSAQQPLLADDGCSGPYCLQ